MRLSRALLSLSALSLLVVTLGGSLVLPSPASAHELLPFELVKFLKTHPNASEAEVNAFLQSSPELTSGDASYQERLVDTVFSAQAGFWENAWSFILLGIKHILEGADHVLFVLSLLLTFVTLRQTLKSISAFTVAHSITLILAGLSIITLRARIVEPIIALSIAFVAIGTVFLRRYQFFASLESKIAIIFLFGLFHGLGFAGLLQDFSIPEGRFVSSLLFFNVGIEIGQMIIIAAVVPFILLFRKKLWYPRAIQGIAVAISACALYWFAERALEIG